MTEEIRNEEIKPEEKVCRCEQDMFKKFALITAGAFTGCLLALCVYTSFAKPPVPPAPVGVPPVSMQRPCPHHEFGRPDFGPEHRLDRRDHRRGDFHRKHHKGELPDRPQPDQEKLSR